MKTGPKPQPRDEYLADRFIPEPNSGCWLWIGTANRDGYGVVPAPRPTVRGNHLAHRVAWETYRGPIPFGMLVLHRCDTPGCINLDHLYLGTPKNNAADMVRRGRNRNGVMFGDDNPSRKYPERRPRGAIHSKAVSEGVKRYWVRRKLREAQQ